MSIMGYRQTHEEYSLHWGFVVATAKFIHWAILTGLLKSFSIFIPHLVELMGTSYAAIGFVSGMPDSLGCTAPLVAYIAKRVSPRCVAFVGSILISAGLICASFCTTIAALGICTAAIGIGNIMMLITMTTSLHQHFPVKFDVINTISLVGSPAGAFIIPVVTEKLLEIYGLRGTIFILGAFSLHSVVCAIVLRPPRPKKRNKRRKDKDVQYIPVQKDAGDHGNVESGDDAVIPLSQIGTEDTESGSVVHIKQNTKSFLTHLLDITNLSVLRRTPVFAFLLIPNYLMMVVWMGWTLFLIPHAESLGINQSQAAYLAMLGGIGGICGLIWSSAFITFFPGAGMRLPVVTSLICSVVFFLDLASNAYLFQAIHAFIIGFMVYHISLYISVGVKYCLPDEDFAMGLGLALFVYALGNISGGLGAGLIYDLTRNYKNVFVVFGVAELLISLSYTGYLIAQNCQRRKTEKRIQERDQIAEHKL